MLVLQHKDLPVAITKPRSIKRLKWQSLNLTTNYHLIFELKGSVRSFLSHTNQNHSEILHVVKMKRGGRRGGRGISGQDSAQWESPGWLCRRTKLWSQDGDKHPPPSQKESPVFSLVVYHLPHNDAWVNINNIWVWVLAWTNAQFSLLNSGTGDGQHGRFCVFYQPLALKFIFSRARSDAWQSPNQILVTWILVCGRSLSLCCLLTASRMERGDGIYLKWSWGESSKWLLEKIGHHPRA